MANRVLKIRNVVDGSEELEAELERMDDISDEEIERELLAVIYKCDPSLEDESGRLLPGAKSSEISLSLMLTEPDSEGVSYLGGIRGQEELLSNALQELKEIGYEILDGRV